MRVLTALLAAAVLATTASAQVAAKSPGEDDPGSFPTWSPDGSRLIFWRGRGRVVVQVTGVAQQRLPLADGVWSPDGKKLAFIRSSKVFVADADGANPRQIAEGHDLSWSPDSRQLAITNTSLFLVGADGTALRQIAQPAPCTTCHARYHITPNWSPRGDWIAFVDAINHDGVHGSGTLHVIRHDGTGEQAVGSTLSPSGISWSPDGRWLGYSDSYDFSERTEFFVARESDGFRSRFVGHGDGGTWAPTSSYVIRRSAGDLFVTRPEGGAKRIAKASFPSWSPDGEQLAFQRGDSIFVGSPGSADVRRVIRGRHPSFSPRWTIAYASLGCGKGQGIHVIRPDGRGHRRLTTACSIGGDYGNDAIRAGAEAQSVAARSGNDLVHGEAGNDAIDGGRGDDVLYGDSGNDLLVGGADVDRLYGGPGRDRLRSRDAWRDAVACGPGRDTVEADFVDLVAADCEVVRKR